MTKLIVFMMPLDTGLSQLNKPCVPTFYSNISYFLIPFNNKILGTLIYVSIKKYEVIWKLHTNFNKLIRVLLSSLTYFK